MIWELLRARSRLIVLTTIAAGLAGCSSEATRFSDNRYDNRYSDNRYAARPAPQPEPMGAMPSSSRIEQTTLPPPSGVSGQAPGPMSMAPDAGYSGGGRSMGMASYQPTYQPAPPVPPEVTGSAAPRKPASASSPWSWEGGTAIIVAQGETIDVIAQRHNVPAAALVEANSLPPGAAIRPGQRLVIPRYTGAAPSAAPSPIASNAGPRPSPAPVSALAPAQPAAVTGSSGLHVVAAGDTLYKISRTYGRSVTDLAKANNIEPTATLKIGDRIVIPGGPAPNNVAKGKSPQPLAAPSAKAAAAGRAAASAKAASAKGATPAKATPAKATPAPKQPEQPPQQAAVVTPSDETPVPTPIKSDASPGFRWPVKGRVIAGFGPKPNGQQNDGINLAVPEGTPVKAAEDGVVAYAGNELKGYGNLVLVRHANGYVTAYAHAKELLVKRGDQVKRGQVIANSGQTGNVDTPQLHFEVRKGPAPLDPMPLLTGG
jgi:murein DD-endopeptidase MepM/ murein hydrolase activator NlpD